MSNALLQLRNIHKSYQMGSDVVSVLKGVNLEVKEGEFVAIMGASGSGKSTLLHIAGALDQPDARPAANGKSGQVDFRDQPVSTMSRRDRHTLRNKQFGFVFQFYHLLPELSVLENVLLPSIIKPTPRWIMKGLLIPGVVLFVSGILGIILGALFFWPVVIFVCALATDIGLGVLATTGIGLFVVSLSRMFIGNPRKQEALRILDAFGLSHRLKHRPGQLSGGERQRVAIARALINKPAILLADEPTGNLDAKTGRTILDVLVKLHKESGQTILLVTHDPHVAALADRTVELVEGRIKEG
jgi:lipoprotein-releasing system ATP-binding protein